MPRPKNSTLLQYFTLHDDYRVLCNNDSCVGRELVNHSANLQRHLRSRHRDLYTRYVTRRFSVGGVKDMKDKRTRSLSPDADRLEGSADLLPTIPMPIKSETLDGPVTPTILEFVDDHGQELQLQLHSDQQNSQTPTGLRERDSLLPTDCLPPAKRTSQLRIQQIQSNPGDIPTALRLHQQPQSQQREETTTDDKRLSTSSPATQGLSLFNSFGEHNSTDSMRLLEQTRSRQEDETNALNFFKSLMPDYNRLGRSKQRKLKEFFIKKLNEMLDEDEEQQQKQ